MIKNKTFHKPTCKFNDDQQWLSTGLGADAKEVDDVYMAPDLLHYLHLLVTMVMVMVVMMMLVMMMVMLVFLMMWKEMKP